MEAIQYNCPNCSAPLSYKADKQGFGCDYCLSFFTDAEIKTIFEDNENTNLNENIEPNNQNIVQEQNEFAQSTNLYSCSSCGAEIMAENTTAATFCIYCHSPVVLAGRLAGDYKPNKVIPFTVTKAQAVETFKKWVSKKKFVPTDFKSEQQLEKMVGLYVPFWLADCHATASVNAIGKNIRTWSSGSYRYTETKEYAVDRAATLNFKGVPADGASKIEDNLMQAIEPFDYEQIKPFSMSHLSGFLADKYDVNKADVFPIIKKRVDNGCEDLIRQSITGYSSVTMNNLKNNILNTNWNYALLPVWFMTYNYNGKMYEFAINGQTGKTAGLPPLSTKKLLAFCGGFALALTLILTIGGYFIS